MLGFTLAGKAKDVLAEVDRLAKLEKLIGTEAVQKLIEFPDPEEVE